MELADANFDSDFPIQTGQRWWELETAWFLYNCGFDLSKKRTGSDFLCKRENIVFEVEAVVAGPGRKDHPDYVPEFTLTGSRQFQTSGTIKIPERERIEILRLTNSISTKAIKHLSDIKKGYSDPSIPFVIALSPVDMRDIIANGDMPAALKAVYPIGGQYRMIDPVTGEFLPGRRWKCRPLVNKKTPSHAAISTQIFCPGCGNEQSRKVSALLYSTMNIWIHGYPYSPGEHQKQFVVVHNNDCNIPLIRGTIKAGVEYWLESTGTTNEYELTESKI
ncbi:MAG: hypothetical protein QY305_10000 [Candidatus Brocadiaceae baterium WH-1]|nr:MAG: hypothetical protein QY305_10000 [Candidatus Jettenia sp. AMX2]